MILAPNDVFDAKMLRKAAKLKFREIAQELGVHIVTVQRWESGESVPMIPLDKVVALTRLYDCSVEELSAAYTESRRRYLEKQGKNATEH
jgi:transcriptional regulator with XRE-family HTH domain